MDRAATFKASLNSEDQFSGAVTTRLMLYVPDGFSCPNTRSSSVEIRPICSNNESGNFDSTDCTSKNAEGSFVKRTISFHVRTFLAQSVKPPHAFSMAVMSPG